MGRDAPLPTQRMRERWGHLPYLRKAGRNVWSASCPECGYSDHDWNTGDPDRFVIYPPSAGYGGKARGWCRRCNHLEFINDDDDHCSPSPEAIAEAEASRKEWEERERKRIEQAHNRLRASDFWLRYHEEMTDEQRKTWHRHGIKDWAIEMHKLGYRIGETEEDEALSIPYFARSWDNIVSLQYRLLCPDPAGGKYRFMYGATQEWFRPWPEDEIEGVVLILEGAKKALVTYEMAHDILYRGERVTMIATPSKNTPGRLIDQLDDAELLIWLLDPDAYIPIPTRNGKKPPSIERNIEVAGPERSLIVRPPEKIDDMIIQYGLGRSTIQAMVNQAGPWFGYQH